MPIPAAGPADELQRRTFTVAEILRMEEAGIIRDEENYELIEGEIVLMHAKTHIHELIKSALMLRLARALPDDLWFGVESTMYLSDRTFVEPDLVVYRRGLKLEEVKGRDILLAIEVVAASLKFDRGVKAQLYARYGVQELWVVDAAKRRVFIHTGPTNAGWAKTVELGPHDMLSFAAIDGFEITLADI